MTAPSPAASLPERLDALAGLASIGRSRDGFDAELLAESDMVLRRAAQRLRLSAGHTVVAIAGGTGSGKSTLFNALAKADFSPSAVTRPATRDVHACVWGMEGAAPLLDWLGVGRRFRYERASALDSGETELRGLVLLDLPDHDSVIESSAEITDRISKLADMLIWVLDPQKYADAAVHNRYLAPLAGHAGVLAVVLSQADLLTPEEADDCGEDLRRLLDSEGLEAARLYTVSARTGAGLDKLRGLLAEMVGESRTSAERISADIDSLLSRYGVYAAGPVAPDGPHGRAFSGAAGGGANGASGGASNGAPGGASGGARTVPFPALAGAGSGPLRLSAKPPWEMDDTELTELRASRHRPPWEDAAPDDEEPGEPDPAELARNVPEGPAAALTSALADTSGLAAVADARAGAIEERAARLTGWPVARPLRRRSGPGRSPDGPPGLAPQSEVDNAITAFADAVGGRLPEPWPSSVVRAARSRADEVPPALAGAVGLSGAGQPATPPRWRLVAAWQWFLLIVAVAALIGAAAAGVAHGLRKPLPFPLPFSDVWLIPSLAGLAVVMLVLGWLTAVGCRDTAVAEADRERERATDAMRDEVASVTRDLLLVPVGREIAAYERFRRELSAARGGR